MQFRFIKVPDGRLARQPSARGRCGGSWRLAPHAAARGGQDKCAAICQAGLRHERARAVHHSEHSGTAPGRALCSAARSPD